MTPRIAISVALGVIALLLTGAASAGATQVQVVVTTADESLHLQSEPALTLAPAPTRGALITIDDTKEFQQFDGVGAAMTDSSAWLIGQLSPTLRNILLQYLFGASGLHLGFIRIPIGASDYTAGGMPYSYDDLAAGLTDSPLAGFSIGHDESYILPELRTALRDNPDAFVLAEPWSPPAWMKANDSLDNASHGGTLLPQYLPTFAQYLVKFLQAYAAQGVHVDAITPQNEPQNPTAYPGLELPEPQEASFILSDLVPALAAAHLRPEIYGYDNGWAASSVPYATALADSPAAARLTGIATHCYYGSPRVIGALHRENPGLDEIVSECSAGITPFPTSELLISAMRNWASSVALWNLALDPQGGPVQEPNRGCPNCTGVVTIDPTTGQIANTIDALQLGQVSRFVLPGAVRIASNHFVSYRYLGKATNIASPGLDDVAFANPNGQEVLIAFDNGPQPATFTVDTGIGRFAYTLAAGETGSFVW